MMNKPPASYGQVIEIGRWIYMLMENLGKNTCKVIKMDYAGGVGTVMWMERKIMIA